jgi:hypothetical protein
VDSRLRSGTATVTVSHAEPLHHTHQESVSSSGIEPDLRPSQSRVRAGTLRGQQHSQWTYRDSNPDCTVRRTGILPLEHRPILQPVPRPGVEPGQRPSDGRLMSVSPPGHKRVAREGIEPSRRFVARVSETRVSSLFHHLAIQEQWTVEGVEPSSAGCKPAVFPLDDTPGSRSEQ